MELVKNRLTKLKVSSHIPYLSEYVVHKSIGIIKILKNKVYLK